jgi:hypothetical protein
MTTDDLPPEEHDEHEMTFEEFAQKAKERFGDKVSYLPIVIPEEIRAKMRAANWPEKTIDEIPKIQAVWLIGQICPICGEPLNNLFGGFEWGIVHGVGTCSSCRKITLRYYHYVGEGEDRRCFTSFSVEGF